MFEATAINRRNQRTQRLFGLLFLLMTALLVAPVLLILTMLVIKGGPVILPLVCRAAERLIVWLWPKGRRFCASRLIWQPWKWQDLAAVSGPMQPCA